MGKSEKIFEREIKGFYLDQKLFEPPVDSVDIVCPMQKEVKMWLKPKELDVLLSRIKMTREELAQEFECDLWYLNRVCDGKVDADIELSRLIIAAFGADEIREVIDWRKTKDESI